ncbi:MAG TPA: BolA family protein [Alphaproteobacteria bacterium]|nr:BolA family protein [Alphaproteobacteria bacterium]
MNMEEKIRQKLTAALTPQELRVINQSHLHAGHAGDDGSGESHFKIEISAERFSDMSRIARERLVHETLAEEIGQIHALSIKFL